MSRRVFLGIGIYFGETVIQSRLLWLQNNKTLFELAPIRRNLEESHRTKIISGSQVLLGTGTQN